MSRAILRERGIKSLRTPKSSREGHPSLDRVLLPGPHGACFLHSPPPLALPIASYPSSLHSPGHFWFPLINMRGGTSFRVMKKSILYFWFLELTLNLSCLPPKDTWGIN